MPASCGSASILTHDSVLCLDPPPAPAKPALPSLPITSPGGYTPRFGQTAARPHSGHRGLRATSTAVRATRGVWRIPPLLGWDRSWQGPLRSGRGPSTRSIRSGTKPARRGCPRGAPGARSRRRGGSKRSSGPRREEPSAPPSFAERVRHVVPAGRRTAPDRPRFPPVGAGGTNRRLDFLLLAFERPEGPGQARNSGGVTALPLVRALRGENGRHEQLERVRWSRRTRAPGYAFARRRGPPLSAPLPSRGSPAVSRRQWEREESGHAALALPVRLAEPPDQPPLLEMVPM